MRRGVAALVLVVGIVLGSATAASAHATLQATTPADRAHLDAAPAVVTLDFSEDIRASLGAVKVVSDKGSRVDNGNLVVRGHTVSLGLQGGLGDGAYIVTWRVISADSHPVRGAFTFTVGAGSEASSSAVANALDDSSDRSYDIAGGIFRGFAYGGALLAAGGALFLFVAFDGGPERRALVRVVSAAAAIGAVGVVAAIPIQAALATGLGLRAITQSGVLGDVLGDGVLAATVTSLLGLAMVVVGLAWRRRWLGLAGAALAVGGFALSGHTTTSSPAWLASLADVAHLLAGAAWLGGVVLLTVVLLARRDGDAVATGRVVVSFSRIASVAVLAIGVTGLTLGLIEVGSLDELTSTRYGWELVAKSLLVAGIAALGAYNHFRLVPALERAPKKAGARLRSTVRIEALAMVGVLALTAVLVNTTPARSGEGGIQSVTEKLGAGSVNLVVDPAKVGTNSIHLYLLDESGRNITVQSVALELSLPSAQIGPIDRDTFVAGPGHYQLDSNDLSVPGKWSIAVKARVDKFTEETATVEVTVRP